MAVVALCAIAGGDVIRLKSSVLVDFHQDVRLGDIAAVTADNAEAGEELANTIIIPSAEKAAKIKIDDVVMAIISQHGPKAAAGNLQIGGAPECDISIKNGRPLPTAAIGDATANQTMGAAELKPAPSPQNAVPVVSKTPSAVPAKEIATDGSATLSDIIKARVQKELAVPMEDISVRFETISPLLDHEPAAGSKWLCRPLTRTFLGTVPFEAQLVQGTKVVEKIDVQTTIERLQWVAVNTARVGRGDVISAKAVHLERLPIDRKSPSLFANENDVIGLEAQRDMDIGTVLDQRDFRPAYLAHKNDPITVIYVAGSLTVQMRGRAMGDAKLHEPVQVRNESTHEIYTATVIARDIAVAGGTLSEEQEKQIREGIQ